MKNDIKTKEELLKIIDKIEEICEYISTIPDKDEREERIFYLNGYELKVESCGHPHKFNHLDEEHNMAIYMFKDNKRINQSPYLKIGKATYNARFSYQHYNPKANKSTLAKRLIENNYDKKINNDNIKVYMNKNLQRINIIMDKKLGIFTLNLFESYLHSKYNPLYEGYESQRN